VRWTSRKSGPDNHREIAIATRIKGADRVAAGTVNGTKADRGQRAPSWHGDI
jgi:hypothetical protein